jgi:hypothetical protein
MMDMSNMTILIVLPNQLWVRMQFSAENTDCGVILVAPSFESLRNKHVRGVQDLLHSRNKCYLLFRLQRHGHGGRSISSRRTLSLSN